MIASPLLIALFTALGLVVSGHLWAAHFTRRSLLAAFRLRHLGLATSAIVGALVTWQLLAAVVWGLRPGQDAALLVTLALGIGCALLSWLAVQSYRPATRRALKHASTQGAYTRVLVYRAYTAAFPDELAALLPHFNDTASMRLAAELIERNTTLSGRPLEDALARHLQEGGDVELIKRALDLKLFHRRPTLERRLRKHVHEAGALSWEAILTRQPGAHRVGHTLAQLLESAVAYQDPTLRVAVCGLDRLDKAGRLALNLTLQRLDAHFAKINLKLVPDDPHTFYATHERHDRALVVAPSHTPPDQAWCLRIEALECTSELLQWQEYQTQPKRARGKHALGSLSTAHSHIDPLDSLSGRMVTKTSAYPKLRLACAITHRGRAVAQVEVDSSSGFAPIAASRAQRKGTRPVQAAAQLLTDTLTACAGLRIMPPPASAPAAAATPRAAAPSAATPHPSAAATPAAAALAPTAAAVALAPALRSGR